MPIAPPSPSVPPPIPGVLQVEATLVPSRLDDLAGTPRPLQPTPCDALHLAAWRNDLPSLLAELATVKNPNVPDGNGEPAVVIAMKADRMALVEALVHDPRVDLTPSRQGVPHVASLLGMAQLVREADPERLSQAHTDAWPHEQPPLHWAMSNHKPQLFRWLMAHGADHRVAWDGRTVADRINRERLMVERWHHESDAGMRKIMAITGQRSEALVRAFDESMVVVETHALNQALADVHRSPETSVTSPDADGAPVRPNARPRSRL